MFFSTVIRRCLLPAAAVVAEAKLTSKEIENANNKTILNKCRPSELPIYTPEASTGQDDQDHEPNIIENTLRSIRHTWHEYVLELESYEKVALASFDDGKQNVEWLIDYLRKEDNTLPKAGAIGIGALTGLIFGLRGGFFKKTIYASTGALGMAAVCYPKEASEYAEVGVVEGKKILTIAYNFIYGVKKDDPPLELPSLPKLPTTLSEAWGSVKSGASSLFSDSTESSFEKIEGNKEGVSSDDGAPPRDCIKLRKAPPKIEVILPDCEVSPNSPQCPPATDSLHTSDDDNSASGRSGNADGSENADGSKNDDAEELEPCGSQSCKYAPVFSIPFFICYSLINISFYLKGCH